MKNVIQIKYIFFFLIQTLFITVSFSQTGWLQVSSFGANPGNLNMYRYVPDSVSGSVPLVVVLHGCTENATGFSSETGWDVLAEKYKFYVIYAEQQITNNSSDCFNWFLSSDNKRGQGEALSVKQMIDYMKNHFTVDSLKVYVTGLSAGGCLTAVMMGAYPEVFAAGAVMAGAPYKSATDALSAMNVMYGLVTKTPAAWGDSVRNENPVYTGSYPRVAIFQGTSDYTIYPVNARELMKQWTNVHNTDTIADSINAAFNGNSNVQLKQYYDASGKTVVQTYMINAMQHGISVDPGTCFQQGGIAGAYSYDENFYSSFWAAEFFGIIQNPYPVNGPVSVIYGQTNIVFSVPYHFGSTYQWSFPAGVTVLSGQGTSQVTVTWGNISGFITVNETNSVLCIIGPTEIYVNATVTGINENNLDASDIKIFTDKFDNVVHVNSSLKIYNVLFYNMDGKLVFTSNNQSGNTIIYLPYNLQEGIYIVKVVSGNKIYNLKYIKINL